MIFLGDGNAFDLPASRLFGILEMIILQMFPLLQSSILYLTAPDSGIS